MPTEKDDWGRDPSVQKMRQIFSKMEHAHNLLIEQLQISWFDTRLGDVRETARVLFERAFSMEKAQDREIDDRAMISLYLDALSQALRRADISIPHSLQTDPKSIVDEVIPCSG